MPATDTLHLRPRTASPRLPGSDDSLLPELLLDLPGTAIRREPVLQLGFDQRSGTYHLSIAAPRRSL